MRGDENHLSFLFVKYDNILFMKICFLPIDNRPVCYNLASDIVAMDKSIELFLPPREFLGSLIKNADIEGLFDWLKNVPLCDAIILSLDTIAYGGLIPSRRSNDDFDSIRARLNALKEILNEKNAKIYAFSSVMRISNNNYNEEEKEYWKDFGIQIFKYSYETHKFGESETKIPLEVLEDYLNTRKRNFEINKIYLEWQKEGFFDTLIFSKDDCADYGLNVKEAKELEKLGGKIKTGADEIPLTLLSRAIQKNTKIFVKYLEPESKHLISNYEDVSIEESVSGQLELAGLEEVKTEKESDVVLVVNNFKEKQGELVMGWETEPFSNDLYLPNKPYIVADVRYANGADNNFVKELFLKMNLERFMGFSAWNTSANTLGSLLAGLKVKYNAVNYHEDSYKRLQMIRFLDDWAYQANVRGMIEKPVDIKNLMSPFEEELKTLFGYENAIPISYTYPWNRKFEIEVSL